MGLCVSRMTLGHNVNHVTYKRENQAKQAKPNLTGPSVIPMRYGPFCASAMLDLVYSPGRCCFVPKPRKVGAPGPTAAKVGSTRSGFSIVDDRVAHFDCIFTMDPKDAITIDP